MYCSDEQVFISVSVCALCIMFLVSVAVELHSRTSSRSQQSQAEDADQIVQRTCRSPVATHPFLFVAMLLFAGIYVLFNPFATQLFPDEFAIRQFDNKL